MDKILINFKQTVSTIVLDLWGLIKTQGLSFVLISTFAIYQLKINDEFSKNYAILNETFVSYITKDRMEMLRIIEKNTEALDRIDSTIRESNRKRKN